jgi:hypothetical protein
MLELALPPPEIFFLREREKAPRMELPREHQAL